MALDILILAIVIVGGILGFKRGILSQVGSILAVLVGILAARMFGPRVSCIFAGGEPGFVDLVSGYGVVFLAAYLLVWLLAHMVRSVFRLVKFGFVDKLCGALFRIAEWLLLLSLALNFYILLTDRPGELINPAKPWREAVVQMAPAVLGYLSHLADNNICLPDVNSQSEK